MAVYSDVGWGNTAEWGFGFPRNESGPTSFWHNASANWTDKRVGLFLSRHRKGPGEESYEGTLPSWADSEVMTGYVVEKDPTDGSGINQDKYTGEVRTYPFTPGGGWSVPLKGITVNGQSINMTTANSSGPIGLLTMQSQVIAPREVVERIYAAIPGAKLKAQQSNPHNQSWVFPCESTPNISVSLNIGGDEYQIAAVDMVVGMQADNIYGDGMDIGPTPANGSCVGLFRSEYVVRLDNADTQRPELVEVAHWHRVPQERVHCVRL